MRLTRSTTLRFAALVFALQLLATALLLLAVHRFTSHEIAREAQASAGQLRTRLLADYRAGGVARLKASIAQQGGPAGTTPDSATLLTDRNGRYLAGNLAAWPPTVAVDATETTAELYRIGRAAPERMRLVATRLAGGERLLTGHVVEGDLFFTRVMEGAMASALVLAVVFAGLAAWLAARMIERRLGATVAAATAVASGDLSHRVAAEEGGDAFEALGRAINAMLDRIDLLMSELKIATDGLAHDLRSPLTRLRSMLERARAATVEPAARDAIDRAIQEGDRLLAMLNVALQISRAEAGFGKESFAAIDLADLLAGLIEMYEPVAEDAGFTIDAQLPETLVASVHRELVGQAVANLIDNAIKYGSSRILVGVEPVDDAVVITVADDGAGIPADRRAEALRRFGRLDAARSQSGAGLGLSLATAVARLHGGRLTLHDNEPGLSVELSLAVR